MAKQLKVRDKSVKSQGILKRILGGNPETINTVPSKWCNIKCF